MILSNFFFNLTFFLHVINYISSELVIPCSFKPELLHNRCFRYQLTVSISQQQSISRVFYQLKVSNINIHFLNFNELCQQTSLWLWLSKEIPYSRGMHIYYTWMHCSLSYSPSRTRRFGLIPQYTDGMFNLLKSQSFN